MKATDIFINKCLDAPYALARATIVLTRCLLAEDVTTNRDLIDRFRNFQGVEHFTNKWFTVFVFYLLVIGRIDELN